jgi:hypothetical protein
MNVPRMYYQNFDENVTAKYGVIIKGWPLAKFCSPSDVGSRNKLKILLQAWQSSMTHFELLSNDELEEWEKKRIQGKLHVVDEPEDGNDMASGPTQSMAPVPAAANSESASTAHSEEARTTTAVPAKSKPSQRGRKRKANDPFSEVANTVTSTDGTQLSVTKKARKKRSDAGVPRKGKGAATTSRAVAPITVAPADPHTTMPTTHGHTASPSLETSANAVISPAGITTHTAASTTIAPMHLATSMDPATFTHPTTSVLPMATNANATANPTLGPLGGGFSVRLPGLPEGLPAARSGAVDLDFPDFNFDDIDFEQLDPNLLNGPPMDWGIGITNPFTS